MIKKCISYLITGKVQGVWFRAGTKEKAKELGLTGWVRNLSSGQVQALACGTEEQLEVFAQWLQQGPSKANVDSVEMEELDISCEKHSAFRVRRNHK